MWPLLIMAFGLSMILMAASPEQRLVAAKVLRRACELARWKQGTLARALGRDEAQLSRELSGAGRIEFAEVLACEAPFPSALADAIHEHVGADPVERTARRVTELLGEIRPCLACATLKRKREIA